MEIQAGGGSFVLEIQTGGGGGIVLQEREREHKQP